MNETTQYYAFDFNGNPFRRVHDFLDDKFVTVRSEVVPQSRYSWSLNGDFYTKADATKLAANSGGTVAVVPEIDIKNEIYTSISDDSKSVDGCRRRLDVNDYTVAELQEISDYYINAINDEIEAENAQKHDEMLAANARAHESRVFDSNFNSIASIL